MLGLDSPLREVYARGCDLARHGGVGALPSPVLQRVLADVKMMQVLDLREATSGQGWLWDIALSPPLQIQRPPSPALDTAGSSYSDDDRDDEVTRQPLSIPLLGGVDSDGVGAVKVVVKGSTGRGVDKSAVGLRPRPSEIATQQPQFLFEEPPMKKDGKHVESVGSFFSNFSFACCCRLLSLACCLLSLAAMDGWRRHRARQQHMCARAAPICGTRLMVKAVRRGCMLAESTHALMAELGAFSRAERAVRVRTG